MMLFAIHMTWQPPSGSFTVAPLAQPFVPWAKPIGELPKPIEPAWRSDEGLKKLFGIALAKHEKPFSAALEVFPDNTNNALWASWNWLTDPLVVASKDSYAQNIELNENLLDKSAFAAKMLKMSDERDPSGRFFLLEGKDRIAILKLYAEVQGFIGKIAIDASTNHITNNELKITLVKAIQNQEKAATVIEAEPELEDILPINLKLVNTSR